MCILYEVLVEISRALKPSNRKFKTIYKELENIIYPKFQEVALNIPVQKAYINKHSPKLTEALKVQKEYWHREINNIIKKMELEIAEQESKQLALLEKHEDEITQRIYEITKNIDALGNC